MGQTAQIAHFEPHLSPRDPQIGSSRPPKVSLPHISSKRRPAVPIVGDNFLWADPGVRGTGSTFGLVQARDSTLERRGMLPPESRFQTRKWLEMGQNGPRWGIWTQKRPGLPRIRSDGSWDARDNLNRPQGARGARWFLLECEMARHLHPVTGGPISHILPQHPPTTPKQPNHTTTPKP